MNDPGAVRGEAGEAARKEVLGDLDYPMLVVTAHDGERIAGCLVGFHTQCSIDPLRYLVCISDVNHTFGVAIRSKTLALHFLALADTPVARLFGEETGDEVDKFSRCLWTRGPAGVPILDIAGGWIAGPVTDRRSAGDHTAFVVTPTAARRARSVDLLTYRDVLGLDPGHRGGS